MTASCNKLLSIAALALFIMLMFVIVFSWIASSVNSSLPIKSLISEEGVRGFMNGFTSSLANPILVCMIVVSVAWGALIYSGLYKAIGRIYKGCSVTYRQKHALIIAGILLVISFVVIVLLAFIPHAILLGVSGELYPSALFSGLVPLLSFVVVIVSLAYGISCGKLYAIEQIFKSLYFGVTLFAPLFPIYIFSMQLYFAVSFVFF